MDSLPLEHELKRRIEEFARLKGATASEVVRDAFEQYAATTNGSSSAEASAESLYDVMKRSGLIGCLDGAPPDLSTNRTYFEGFGRGA